MSLACTCDTIRAIGWCPVHRPPDTRDAERRAATDREIVRVVREWYADHDSAIPLAIELEELLEKEGEGTR